MSVGLGMTVLPMGGAMKLNVEKEHEGIIVIKIEVRSV